MRNPKSFTEYYQGGSVEEKDVYVRNEAEEAVAHCLL